MHGAEILAKASVKAVKELADAAQDAMDASGERQSLLRSLDQIEKAQPICAYVSEIKTWSASGDPWSEISQEDWRRLQLFWRNMPWPLDYRVARHGRSGIDNLVEDRLAALPLFGEPEFEALPDEVRRILRLRRRPRPRWWIMAQFLLGAMEKRAAELREQKLSEMEALLLPAFQAFLAEIEDWTRDRAPGSLMTPEEAAKLVAIHQRASEEFKVIFKWCRPSDLERLDLASLRVLLAADDEVFASLPPEAQEMADQDHLPRNYNGFDHQMFGDYARLQGNADWENGDSHMLLQLASDPSMLWEFGGGVFQFWITPAALQRREWSKVRLTFECD